MIAGRGGKLCNHVYLAKAVTQTTSFPSKIPSTHFCVGPKGLDKVVQYVQGEGGGGGAEPSWENDDF